MGGLSTYNLADVWEAVADRVGDRTALVVGDLRRTYSDLEERANRLAHWMAAQGVGEGDHIGLYLTNSPEYIEAMLAAYKLRAVPVNVNYRYVEAELRHLFSDADLSGVVFHREFAARAEAIRPDLACVRWWLAVEDRTSQVTVDGEVRYEEALEGASPGRDFGPRGDGDLYVIYTGGTTGLPKGVMWRQADAFFACIGGGDPMRLLGPVSSPGEVLDRILDNPFVYMPVAPLMHAAGQWTALSWLYCGGTVVLVPGPLDPVRVWQTVAAEKVNLVTLVGDAIARPLVDAWVEKGPFDASSLVSIASGGAPLSPAIRSRIMELFPEVTIADGFGSSETGAQGTYRIEPGSSPVQAASFTPFDDSAAVIRLDTLEPVRPGSGEVGRVARRGHIPIGYYNDYDKTVATFVELAGQRWALTGDMATVDSDGSINLLGRGSVCINTGGEKVHPEEVEATLKSHPAVYDVVVVGVPDQRWGERVAAVAQLRPGAQMSLAQAQEHCRTSLAGYKIPRALVLVDQVQRSPAGKADYRWATKVAGAADR